MATTASLSASQSAFQQFRLQQAERAAQFAEQQARMLQLQAQSAKSEASRAQQEAHALEAQSNQAGINAKNARQRAEAEKTGARLDGQLEQRLQVQGPEPVINTQGQVTGLVVSTVA